MITFGTHTPTRTENHVLGGEHHYFEFPNGFIASVIPERDISAFLQREDRNDMTMPIAEGLWELAVMDDKQLRYDTPVTDDVERWQTPEEIGVLLDQIAALPKELT